MARYRAGDLDITSYALPPEQFAKLQKELPGEYSRHVRLQPILMN